MTIGYFLMGQDNDSYFLDLDNLYASKCFKCECLLDSINYFNPSFKLKKRTYDLSYTYDGRCIVSLKFKEFCIRNGYQGLTFKVFEREPNFFLLNIKNEVEFDSEKSGTSFIKYCDVCLRYEEVVGFSPGYLKNVEKKLKDGFYRTNLLFGAGNSKHPIIIVAPETQSKLKAEKMKGVYIEPVSF